MNSYENPRRIMVLDTETANTLQDENGKLDMNHVLFYDLGFAVVDLDGEVYETRSYVNSDIFFDEPHLMETAFYAQKLPLYYKDIREGKRMVASTKMIHFDICRVIEQYNIKVVCAHNARFDIRAMNNTQRYVTKSKYRYFLPREVDIWDSMLMAKSTILRTKSYGEFVAENKLFTPTGKLPLKAETLYKYITGELTFEEEHTGLEDVLIEAAIVAYCHKLANEKNLRMKKVLYAHSGTDEEEDDDFLPFF